MHSLTEKNTYRT